MSRFFAVLLVLHAIVHLLGPIKAFGLAALPQLTRPVSIPAGLCWLLASVLFLTTAAGILVSAHWWWLPGGLAMAASQTMIALSWPDTKFGSLPNLVAAAGVLAGFHVLGPFGLRAQYDADAMNGLSRFTRPVVVTDGDLARLPAPVARYLRLAGVVGQPRAVNVRARMHGRIRSGPDAPWMPFTAEQYNFFDQPSRFFYMEARRGPVPIQGLHRYAGPLATMQVKAAGLFTVASAGGETMTQAETVTLFNDRCLLAPATLIDPAISWDTLDNGRVRALFTNAGFTIRADLTFNDAGELVDFWSGDRYQSPANGETQPVPWSTPVGEYGRFGVFRLISRGEGRWHESAGEYTYIEIQIDDIRFNISNAR